MASPSTMIGVKNSWRMQLPVLLAMVFFSRLLAALAIWAINGPRGFWSMDTETYLGPAASMLHGSFSRGGAPEIMRTPGYPFFLVPAVASHHPVVIAVLENALLAVLSACLIWKIVNDVTPFAKKATVWAVLLYCFEPVGFIYSEKILSDQLFSTQLLLFLWLTVRFIHRPTYMRLIALAHVLGVATYTRPVSLFLGLWLLPFFLFFPRQLPWTKRFSRTVIFLLVFILTLTPWVVRNALVADYAGFSSVSDRSLYFYSAAAVNARLEHKSFAQMQAEMGWNSAERYFNLHPEQRNWTEAQVVRYQQAEARRIISHHLLSYTVIHLRGCAVVMLDPGVTEIMKLMRRYPENGGLLSRAADQGLLRATIWLIRTYPETVLTLPLLGGQLVLYYALAVIGLRRLPFEVSILLISVAAYLVLVSGGPVAVARYRMPIMPLICVAAAVAVAAWQDSRLRNSIRAGSQAEATI